MELNIFLLIVPSAKHAILQKVLKNMSSFPPSSFNPLGKIETAFKCPKQRD